MYFFVYAPLFKVISHYDLNVLSMSVMGFQKSLSRVVSGWGEPYPVIWGIFNFARPQTWGALNHLTDVSFLLFPCCTSISDHFAVKLLLFLPFFIAVNMD